MPEVAFTNSTRFTYVESFLMGLNLQRQFEQYADLCQEAIFEGLDEWTIFRNNFTETYRYTDPEDIKPLLPIMRFLQTVGGNSSEAFPYCYGLLEEGYDYVQEVI